jgi:hypothetical protein
MVSYGERGAGEAGDRAEGDQDESKIAPFTVEEAPPR